MANSPDSHDSPRAKTTPPGSRRDLEKVKYVSLTNHMWSRFNAMANLVLWKTLPGDVRDAIERNYARYVRLQRAQQSAFNASLRDDFAKRGLVFNEADQSAFRARLPKEYEAWKEKLGTRCWSLLEAEVGKLG